MRRSGMDQGLRESRGSQGGRERRRSRGGAGRCAASGGGAPDRRSTGDSSASAVLRPRPRAAESLAVLAPAAASLERGCDPRPDAALAGPAVGAGPFRDRGKRHGAGA